MSEFDDKRPEDGPPPLVPPPVRANDGDHTNRSGESTETPLFVEPGENVDAHNPSTNDDSAQHIDATDAGTTDTHAADADHDRPVTAHYPAVASESVRTAEVSPTSDDNDGIDDSDRADRDRADDNHDRADLAQPVAAPVAASALAPIARDQQPDYSAQPTVQQPAAQQPAAPQPAQQTAQYSAPPAPQQTQSTPSYDQQQRSFTPPPVEPKKKGNRGVGSLIAVLSVIIFAVIYVAVTLLIVAVTAPQQSITEALTLFLVEPLFFVPVIFFVIGFLIVVLLVNRANWWAFVLGSLFVGALVYFGTIGVQLLLDNVLADTPDEASARFVGYAVNPYVIAAGLVAREVSMWIGAAISSRGRRVKAKNIEARDEYERAAAQHRAEYERGYAPA